jgi:hypothetical protein
MRTIPLSGADGEGYRIPPFQDLCGIFNGFRLAVNYQKSMKFKAIHRFLLDREWRFCLFIAGCFCCRWRQDIGALLPAGSAGHPAAVAGARGFTVTTCRRAAAAVRDLRDGYPAVDR